MIIQFTSISSNFLPWLMQTVTFFQEPPLLEWISQQLVEAVNKHPKKMLSLDQTRRKMVIHSKKMQLVRNSKVVMLRVQRVSMREATPMMTLEPTEMQEMAPTELRLDTHLALHSSHTMPELLVRTLLNQDNQWDKT